MMINDNTYEVYYKNKSEIIMHASKFSMHYGLFHTYTVYVLFAKTPLHGLNRVDLYGHNMYTARLR